MPDLFLVPQPVILLQDGGIQHFARCPVDRVGNITVLGLCAFGGTGHLDVNVLFAVFNDSNAADRDRIVNHYGPDRFLPALAGQQFQLDPGIHLRCGNPAAFAAAVWLREIMPYSRPRFYPLDPRVLPLYARVSLLAGAPPAVKVGQLFRQPEYTAAITRL